MADENSLSPYNCIILLGPTAVGKTSLGVKLASTLNTEIISADSRQVYKGLDIGSGKDLCEYTVDGKDIPYHLIDITDLSEEYNVFHYQQDFYKVFKVLSEKGIIPVVVGGTGMYLDSIIRSYDMIFVPENMEFRKNLDGKSLEELDKMLLELKPELHNRTDLEIKERVVRALEIAVFMKSDECKAQKEKSETRLPLNPLILGTTIERSLLRKNIEKRLLERLDEGMIEEVDGLHTNGASWNRLERLGLEYKFVSEFLQGKIKSKDELFALLFQAICRFAKRQETWFRGMERKGVKINWLTNENNIDKKYSDAMKLISSNFLLT